MVTRTVGGPAGVLLTSGRAPEPLDLRVEGGMISDCAARLEPLEGEQVLDLGGRFVRRSLRDAHVHFADWARSLRELDLAGAASAAEAASRVGAADTALPAGAVLRGSGFRATLWPDEPTARMLERAAPGRVVVLHSLDRHSAWLSPAAQMLCGLPDHPTGLLREHEAWQALRRLPPPSEGEDDDAVAAAVALAHGRGVTAIRDFDFSDPFAAWLRRQERAGGTLSLRVLAAVQVEDFERYAEGGLRTGAGNQFLRVGPLKLFMDGALGSGTARCFTPYAGTSDRGRQLLSPDQLRAALLRARSAGFAVAVHAIGDEANSDALRVLESVGIDASIEHAQLVRPDDVALFGGAGVTASMQPAHLLDDHGLVDELWQGTSSIAFPIRSLVEAGARIVFGSDAPVSPLDPWPGIAAAVHRTDGTMPPWHPEEAIPLGAALAASGARRPQVGDPADLVVLDGGWLEDLAAGELAAAPVCATFLAGRCVHGPWQAA